MSLLGLLLVAMGGVWMLQGLGLAFQVGFMAGEPKWTVYGALLAAVGAAQVWWSNTRCGEAKGPRSPRGADPPRHFALARRLAAA